MAIVITKPIVGVASTTNTTAYSFTAFTPTANAVIYMFFSFTANAGVISFSTGLTWTLITSTPHNVIDTSYLYAAVVGASPVSTIITVTSTVSATGFIGMILQATGTDTTKLSVQTAVNNTGTTSTGNPNTSFGAFTLANNSLMSFWRGGLSAPAVTSLPGGTGWVLGDDISFISPATNGADAYILNQPNTGSILFGANTTIWSMISVEIPIASSVAIIIPKNIGLLGIG